MFALCTMLIIVCYFDYRNRRIPNIMVILIFLMGLGRGGYFDGIRGIGSYFLVGVLTLFCFYPFFRIGGLGAGDVKLLSVCAGYFPSSKIIPFLFGSLLISAIFSVFKLYKEQNVRERICYFCEYCIAVAKSGQWGLYLPQKGGKGISGICMSGPILCSVLLGIGGVY